METVDFFDPMNRQVLVNLGNRFVVFGPSAGLPGKIHFEPNESADLPRVADETEIAEARISETLQVYGMQRTASLGHQDRLGADLELVDSAGRRILIDLKVQDRDPKKRDLDLGLELLNAAKSTGRELEVWFFNIQRLKLTVMRKEGSQLQFDNLMPLNVWSKGSDGIFERQRVVDEVEDWLRRVERLYADVREWLANDESLTFEQARKVTMSEELMQEFAVTDRELSILDLVRGGQDVVASFVPRGLWFIGAWGRIDIIFKTGTFFLVAKKENDHFVWKITSPDDRRHLKPFDKEMLLALMSGQ